MAHLLYTGFIWLKNDKFIKILYMYLIYIKVGKKKLSSNLLDFDEVLNLVLNKEKDKKIKSKKKHKKKLLGFKRKRLIKPKEIKSKTNLYLIFF